VSGCSEKETTAKPSQKKTLPQEHRQIPPTEHLAIEPIGCKVGLRKSRMWTFQLRGTNENCRHLYHEILNRNAATVPSLNGKIACHPNTHNLKSHDKSAIVSTEAKDDDTMEVTNADSNSLPLTPPPTVMPVAGDPHKVLEVLREIADKEKVFAFFMDEEDPAVYKQLFSTQCFGCKKKIYFNTQHGPCLYDNDEMHGFCAGKA